MVICQRALSALLCCPHITLKQGIIPAVKLEDELHMLWSSRQSCLHQGSSGSFEHPPTAAAPYLASAEWTSAMPLLQPDDFSLKHQYYKGWQWSERELGGRSEYLIVAYDSCLPKIDRADGGSRHPRAISVKGRASSCPWSVHVWPWRLTHWSSKPQSRLWQWRWAVPEKATKNYASIQRPSSAVQLGSTKIKQSQQSLRKGYDGRVITDSWEELLPCPSSFSHRAEELRHWHVAMAFRRTQYSLASAKPIWSKPGSIML